MDGSFEQPTRQFPAERYFPGRKMFGGRFVLERRIGRGGMGEVWLASDNELGRDVALKFAPAEVANDPKSVAELRREVIAGLELSHPRIARVYDLQVGDGEAAISIECVKGKSLSDLQAETAHGFFEPDEIAGWIDDVKDALDYAHTEAKRTHRDVKPKNILVDVNTGRAKLVDFGISKRLSDSFTRNTGKDSSGSLAYMSPQQMMGERNSEEDDWYSLGATVYELLTGAPPFFRGDVRTQIERVVPPSMTERRQELVGEMIDAVGAPIPLDWEEWVARMLGKERGRMEEVTTPAVAPPLPGAAVVTPPPLPPEIQSPPAVPSERAPAPRPQAELQAEPRAVSRAMGKAVEATAGTASPALGQAPAEGGQETGVWGDEPKKSKGGRPKNESPELRPMTGGDGLVWAGLMALLFPVGNLVLQPMMKLADSMGMELLGTAQEVTVLAFLAVGMWWRFRRQGNAVWLLIGVFLGVSVVVAGIREFVWHAMMDGGHVEDVRSLMLVDAFLLGLALAVSFLVAMGVAFKTWLFRLLIAGLVAGAASVLVQWFSFTYGVGLPGPVLLLGPVFVGGIFGVVSGLTMVRSGKVMV